MEIWLKTSYLNYEVSNLGNVRNIKTGKILTNSLSKSNGYYKVTLSVNGKSKPIEVHRLVAETFKPNETNQKLVVDHIDSNKLNNDESNLQWITSSANTTKANRVNKNPRFTDVQKAEIKKLYANGMSLIKLTIHCNALWRRTSSRQSYTNIVRK